MVVVDFTGQFLNAENADDGDIIVIVSQGELVKKEWGEVLDLDVELNEKPKIYTPTRETGSRFVAKWGSDSKAWVGHKAQVKHVLKQIKGKTETRIECFPLD